MYCTFMSIYHISVELLNVELQISVHPLLYIYFRFKKTFG